MNAPANGAEKAMMEEEQKGANPDNMEQEGEKKLEGGANVVKSDMLHWKKE